MARLFYTLKSRMTAAFLLITLITLLLASAVSYYTIYSILYNKIERNIELQLEQVAREMDLAMDNLLSVAGQLSYGGIVSNDLANYLSTDSFSSKRTHSDNIESYLHLIDHTNPTAGLHFYYRTDSDDFLFANAPLKPGFRLEGLPVMTNETLFAFFGPHPSFAKESDELVISLSRPVNLRGDYGLRLYLESSAETLKRILRPEQFGMPASYAIVGFGGRVVYSGMPETLATGAKYEGHLKTTSDAYLFETESRYGWKLVAAFGRSVFNEEIVRWIVRLAALGALVMIVSLLLGFVVWRAVYRPIKMFQHEIGLLASNQFDTATQRANVAEFDKVLKEFHQMKERIQSLLVEVQQKEADKKQLEFDKLLSQINPHFLYNTLNTVQWIAKAEGQHRIVKIVAELTRLLRYNLGKEGQLVTIGREVSALKDYVSLQLVRNDYQFEVHMDVEDEVLDVEIPRFVLQPLVENAIYHGLRDGEGAIRVSIRREGEDDVRVEVRDDGAGLTEEKREQLLRGEPGEAGGVGFGIGLSYVNKMLEVYCGARSRLQIDSVPGKGTAYRFIIPNRRRR